MWFKKNDVEVETPSTEKTLQQKYDELLNNYEAMEKANKDWQKWHDDLVEKQQDAEVALDFEKLDVFSVERNMNNEGKPYTIIGYLKTEYKKDEHGNTSNGKAVKEWYYHCTDRRHQEIVDAFKKFRDDQTSRKAARFEKMGY